MTTDTWLLYVGTVLIFMSTPGPSHVLMLSVSMSNGFHRSLATAAGDLSANSIQILLAGLGLAPLLPVPGMDLQLFSGRVSRIWFGSVFGRSWPHTEVMLARRMYLSRHFEVYGSVDS